MDGIENILCPICDNRTNSFITFEKCGHLICQNCIKNYLLENDFKIKKKNNFKCLLENCNEISIFSKIFMIRFIKRTNDRNLNNKYKRIISMENLIEFNKITILDYISHSDYTVYYLKPLEWIADKVSDCFYDNCYKCADNAISTVIGIISFILLLFIYVIIVPIYFHIKMRILYYNFINKAIIQAFNKPLGILILFAEEILCLIYLFPFIIAHYFISLGIGIYSIKKC